MLHTRLRTNCSGLNNDLFLKNIVESPLCQCGRIENEYHYIFECPLYTQQRLSLFNSLSLHHNLSINLVLFGETSLSDESNALLFEKVQKYIIDTKRFE